VPYPVFFAVLCGSSYLVGVLLSWLMGSLDIFLADHGFVLLCLFGFVCGFFALLLARIFDDALEEAKSYAVLSEEEWRRFASKVRGLVGGWPCLAFFLFWVVYSFYCVFVSRDVWWSRGYSWQFAMDVYGFLVQALNGCFLGGVFMGMVSVGFNLAFREISAKDVFKAEVASARGGLARFRGLVLAETFAAAVASALAISIWSGAAGYTPVIGSLAMVVPTAIYPHYVFHGVLSRAKERRIKLLEERIDAVPSDERTTLGDLITFNKLVMELEKAKNVKPWLVDLKAVLKLVGATAASQVIALVIDYLV